MGLRPDLIKHAEYNNRTTLTIFRQKNVAYIFMCV
jgi:hypothetical protein